MTDSGNNSILRWEDIHPGQMWEACDGAGHEVKIIAVNKKEVWYQTALGKIHDKDPFSFQCRYKRSTGLA